jgi:hypothetical protein
MTLKIKKEEYYNFTFHVNRQPVANEIAWNIFSRLSALDLFNVTKVCKHWHWLAKKNYLWKMLAFGAGFTSSEKRCYNFYKKRIKEQDLHLLDKEFFPLQITLKDIDKLFENKASHDEASVNGNETYSSAISSFINTYMISPSQGYQSLSLENFRKRLMPTPEEAREKLQQKMEKRRHAILDHFKGIPLISEEKDKRLSILLEKRVDALITRYTNFLQRRLRDLSNLAAQIRFIIVANAGSTVFLKTLVDRGRAEVPQQEICAFVERAYPLTNAVYIHNNEMLGVLLELGMVPTNEHLSVAIDKGNVKAVELLLQKKAPILAKNFLALFERISVKTTDHIFKRLCEASKENPPKDWKENKEKVKELLNKTFFSKERKKLMKQLKSLEEKKEKLIKQLESSEEKKTDVIQKNSQAQPMGTTIGMEPHEYLKYLDSNIDQIKAKLDANYLQNLIKSGLLP